MKNYKKVVSLFMMSAILILPTTISVQAKSIDKQYTNEVTYSSNDTKQYGNAKINASNVNIRKGPSTSSASLGLLQINTRVQANNSTVVDSSGRKWYYCVTESGLKGFVAAQYVTKD